MRHSTQRLEFLNNSDARTANPAEIALKSFQCTKLLGSRVRALRDESAAAPRHSELDWRRRPTAIRRPPWLADTGTPTHVPRARTPPHSRTTHKYAHTETDKQHKNTPHIATALINTPYFPLLCTQCFQKIVTVLNGKLIR